MIKAADTNLSNSEYRFLKLLEEAEETEWKSSELISLWDCNGPYMRMFTNELVKKGYMSKQKRGGNVNYFKLK